MRTLLLSSLVLLAIVSAAGAEEVVREVSWSQLNKDGKLPSGEVVADKKGGLDVLKVENKEAAPKTINVLDLEQPEITSIHYAIEGRVRYEDVQSGGIFVDRAHQVGYLEMWSWFADGGMYFSRTLGDSGPMQCLDGSSDWRPFSLPFFSDEKTGAPTRIVVNVVLPSRGTVYLSPLRIVQYKRAAKPASARAAPEGLPAGKPASEKLPAEKPLAALRQDKTPLAAVGAWWDDRTAGWIGGIGGPLCGFLGGLIGTFAGLGRARKFVLTLAAGLFLFGLGALVLGLIALGLRQPYGVYYPLLLGGAILTIVMGFLLPMLRQRYQQIELRRMAAMDVGGK